MGNSSNSSLSDLIVIATISSSVLSLPYDSTPFMPKEEASYSYESYMRDWKDNAFDISSDYSQQDIDDIKTQNVLSFTKKILENTMDIDSEYVQVVNENFWDLI